MQDAIKEALCAFLGEVKEAVEAFVASLTAMLQNIIGIQPLGE